MSNKTRTTFLALALVGCTACVAMPWVAAQEKNSEKAAQSEAALSASGNSLETQAPTKPTKMSGSKSTKTSSEASKSTGNTLRLPRYFAGLVDQEQREAIYAIQLDYRSKIAELEEELSRVRQDEQSALEKLLTDSQRKLLAKKRSQSTEPKKESKSANETESETSKMTP